MSLLVQFLLRLCFGLTAAMALTSSRQVSSGYYRNHLYVTLGLASLAALLSHSAAPESFWYAIAAAILSYAGAVSWLYEKPILGKTFLLLVAVASLTGVIGLHSPAQLAKSKQHDLDHYFPTLTTGQTVTETDADRMKERAEWLGKSANVLQLVSNVSSGLLLGTTMAAMLLGHWYLNSPSMELLPLRRLILAMATAIVLQAGISALGLWGEISYSNKLTTAWMLFITLRWTFGLLGVAALAWMAWQTLKIPNTQSATGILYVAVIGTFVGETVALLLSAESLYPL